MAFWNKFFGNAGSQAAGIAIGATAVPALVPAAQLIVNEAWQLHPDKPPDVYAIAAGVAQGQVDEAAARTWAHQQGIGDVAFDALVATADTGPGLGSLMEAYRRGLIGDDAFNTGLDRLAIEPRWWPELRALRRVLLSPSEAANARQQGFLTQAEQVAIAGLHGLTAEDAETQFDIVGLPPGAETAQEYLNRGLIDAATFAEMIREGHTKTKYTDVLRRGAEFVLSPINYVEGRLRGWLTDAEMYAGTSLHGVTPEDTDLLFKIHGRPISFRQTFIGTRRGGTLDGPTAGIDAAFLASLRRSNIQPSFYNIAWAQRFTYPSAFVMRALTQDGTLTAAETEQVLLYQGWEPGFAKTVAEKWAGGTVTTADPHVGRAQTQLWTRAHTAYVEHEADDAAASNALGTLGVDPVAVPTILQLWQLERDLIRRPLTPSQIKKAWYKQVVNPATGAPWSRDDAVAELMQRGMSQADANTFLDE